MSLTLSAGAVAGALSPYHALVLLVGSFCLEIVGKYGLRLKMDWLQAVLLDDIGVMPMMSLTLLTPGLHKSIRTLALVPPFLTACLAFAQICKVRPGLPRLAAFFAPLGEASARYQVMQVRAHLEVALGIVLVLSVFAALAAPLSALLFWNFMMMRYTMSPWTQATFKSIDDSVTSVLSKIPVVGLLYTRFKRFLYSFVDPNSKRKGGLCNVL